MGASRRIGKGVVSQGRVAAGRSQDAAHDVGVGLALSAEITSAGVQERSALVR
jgi:hypothetical protein